MMQKEFASRIIHKHDIETNWNKATNFIPKQGEIIVYDIDDLHDYERIKIGDGVTEVTELPFYQENVAYINATDNETITDPEVESSSISVDSYLSNTSTNPVQNKVVTNKLNQLSEEIANAGGGVQSDWNQTDDTAADFIKNKPFGDTETVILEEQELSFDEEYGGLVGITLASIQDGDKLTVTFDGDVYICNATFRPDMGIVVFGNEKLFGGAIDSGEPFYGAYLAGTIQLLTLDEASHTAGIVSASAKAIPEKYLPAEQLFYFKQNDVYLYVDIECTTKATLYDIPDGLSFQVGFVWGGVSEWIKPTACYSKTNAQRTGYNFVILTRGLQLIELFTAEYTPTT